MKELHRFRQFVQIIKENITNSEFSIDLFNFIRPKDLN